MSSALTNEPRPAPLPDGGNHPARASWGPAATDLVLDGRGLWHGCERYDDLATWAQAARAAGTVLPRQLRLHVTGELLHEWPCDPTLPLADDEDRLAWAQRLQEQYHGPAAARWPLAVWNGRGHGVCSWAYPIGNLAPGSPRSSDNGSDSAHAAVRSWRDQAKRLGLHCASIMPLWRAGLLVARQQAPELSRQPDSTVLFVEGTQVTIIALVRGKPAEVLRRRLPVATLDALRQFVIALPPKRRGCCVALGAGLGVASPEVRQPEPLRELGDLSRTLPWTCPPGLDHSSRSGVLFGPDFCRPARQVRPWPWLSVAVALVMAVVSGYEVLALQQALAAARDSADRTALATNAARDAPHPRSGWLQTPWPTMLQALEHATEESVRWDGLHADVQGRVSAQGRTDSEAAARAVAQRLREHGGWKQVNLARSEASASGWRFEVQGRTGAAAIGSSTRPPGTAVGSLQP